MITRIWYQRKRHILAWMLEPFSYLFISIARKRRLRDQKCAYHSALPVIVVGNIAVGGTGKTPVVQSLCRYLQDNGYTPAVISRGYGGQPPFYPLMLDPSTLSTVCGDEPYMLYHSLQGKVPVVVSPIRSASLQMIERDLPQVNVVIADDGLQHYKMARDFEIVVVDGQRQFGNQLCLPAGPLREPIKRIDEVDAVIINGEGLLAIDSNVAIYTMKLEPQCFVRISDGLECSITEFQGKPLHAIAGIGNPQRFFDLLEQLDCQLLSVKALVDHHHFSAKDFSEYADAGVIVMTEKDASKCQNFNLNNAWYLRVRAEIDSRFYEQVLARLDNFK